VEAKVNDLRSTLESLEVELHRGRDGNSILSEQLTKEEFANKKLEMLEEELERQKNEMEAEIHILLDIEAEKSRTISALELQLHNSEGSERQLEQKLALLTDNFLTLEEHISIMKDRLGNADFRGEEIDKQLQRVEYIIAEKEQLILEQREREGRLRQEIDAHK
jgi:chromosome segregation ATPase